MRYALCEEMVGEKASCIPVITTHNTFFAANDLSYKSSCQKFAFPRTKKCGTILNQDVKKSLHLTTSRHTDGGAKSTISCIRNICSVLNYLQTLLTQNTGRRQGGGVRLVSGSHHSHTSLAPFAMSREVSASLVFGTVLVHTRVSVIKSSGFAVLYFLSYCQLITFTIHFISERHYRLF